MGSQHSQIGLNHLDKYDIKVPLQNTGGADGSPSKHMPSGQSQSPKHFKKRMMIPDESESGNPDASERGQQQEESKVVKKSGSEQSLNFNKTDMNDFSNSESDNSSIFGNRISLSENSAAEQPVNQQPQPKQQDLVNSVFTWNLGGQEVLLIGSFSKWQERIPMQKCGGNEFTLLMTLERCVHQYKFIVDGNWRFATDQPTMRDNQGNINNYIDTTHYAPSSQLSSQPSGGQKDQQKHLKEREKRRKRRDTHTRQADPTQASQNPNPAHQNGAEQDGEMESSSYGQTMPVAVMGDMLGQDAPTMPIHFQYNFLNRDEIPLHNEKFSKPSILLESQQRKATSFFDDTLDIPSHVILNHVNTWKEQQEHMVVTSMTQRLNKTKYVTTIYYKPHVVEEDEPAYMHGIAVEASE